MSNSNDGFCKPGSGYTKKHAAGEGCAWCDACRTAGMVARGAEAKAVFPAEKGFRIELDYYQAIRGLDALDRMAASLEMIARQLKPNVSIKGPEMAEIKIRTCTICKQPNGLHDKSCTNWESI